MAASRPSRRLDRVLRWDLILTAILVAMGLIACLYLGRVVLVPLALAILVSFLLQPIVRMLERIHVPRVPAVLLVTVLLFTVLTVIGWNVVGQLKMLAQDIRTEEAYTENIKSKIADLRRLGSIGLLTDFQAAATEINSELKDVKGEKPEPPELVIKQPATLIERLQTSVLPLLGPLGTASLVLVLAIFILIGREDLRNRIIGLFGARQLMVTTRAIDDAGRRIGRYLLMQLIINVGYGLIMGALLALLGVPFAMLAGLLAALLRYIPYLGPVLGAVLPIATTLIAFGGWSQALVVIGVLIALEMFTNTVAEPLLYGQSVGISPVALIVAATFWTLIWGPIGLVMATPMTVCLVVLGQHVPQLRMLAVLLGDEPALPPPMRYYQRMIARDKREAAALVTEALAEAKAPAQGFDAGVMPALLMMRRDREQGALTAEDESFMLRTTRAIVNELSAKEYADGELEEQAEALEQEAGDDDTPFVLACPAHHESEELALQMLDYAMSREGRRLSVVSTRVMYKEILARVSQERPAAVFIAVIPPSGLEQAAFLCERLRSDNPELPIVVGYWGDKSRFDKILVRMREVGATHVTTSLRQSEQQLASYCAAAEQPSEAPGEPDAPHAVEPPPAEPQPADPQPADPHPTPSA